MEYWVGGRLQREREGERKLHYAILDLYIHQTVSVSSIHVTQYMVHYFVGIP